MDYHTINYNLNRFNPFAKISNVSNVSPGRVIEYISDRAYISNHKTSFDNGDVYTKFERQNMIAVKLYLSNTRYVHDFHFESLLGILSIFGGLFSLFLTTIRGIGSIINYELLLSKNIESIFYKKTDKE